MTDLNQENETINDLLDETIDDLADAPENKPFPNGAHQVSIKIKRATDSNKKPKPGAYIVDLKHIATLELVDPETPEDQLAKPNDTFSVWFNTLTKEGKKNEFAQGAFKKILKPIAVALEMGTIPEVIEATKDGIEVVIVTKIRKSKDPQYADSMNIEKLEVI